MEIPSSQFWENQPCARQETQTLAVLLTRHAWAVEAVLLGTERRNLGSPWLSQTSGGASFSDFKTDRGAWIFGKNLCVWWVKNHWFSRIAGGASTCQNQAIAACHSMRGMFSGTCFLAMNHRQSKTLMHPPLGNGQTRKTLQFENYPLEMKHSYVENCPLTNDLSITQCAFPKLAMLNYHMDVYASKIIIHCHCNHTRFWPIASSFSPVRFYQICQWHHPFPPLSTKSPSPQNAQPPGTESPPRPARTSPRRNANDTWQRGSSALRGDLQRPGNTGNTGNRTTMASWRHKIWPNLARRCFRNLQNGS